jgi:ATP-dependent DNA helicase RecG
MVIEHAERFGLSQLHQLRGRVGRGPSRSSTVLLYQSPLTPEADRRLKAMAETTDGFVIAERDLDIRGPGDYFGTRQSGIPIFQVAHVQRDAKVRDAARDEAFRFADSPELSAPEAAPILRHVRLRWGSRFGLTLGA